MSDRHEKWVRVEPGTVIPAGQPYMIEYVDHAIGCTRAEYVRPDRETTVGHHVISRTKWALGDRETGWFVDSSWKPPLVLPTEPTWGIVVTNRFDPNLFAGSWHTGEPGKLHRTDRDTFIWLSEVVDFISLTDEQVARIEAAR